MDSQEIGVTMPSQGNRNKPQLLQRGKVILGASENSLPLTHSEILCCVLSGDRHTTYGSGVGTAAALLPELRGSCRPRGRWALATKVPWLSTNCHHCWTVHGRPLHTLIKWTMDSTCRKTASIPNWLQPSKVFYPAASGDALTRQSSIDSDLPKPQQTRNEM